MNRISRIGFWSSATVMVIGVGYIFALAAGFSEVGFDEPIGDPVLAVMEIMTILSATAILMTISVIYLQTEPDRKIFGLISLLFASIFTGITSTIHFVKLSAARQLGEAEIIWPSNSYAAELLAWDWFLGLALIFCSMAIAPSKKLKQTKRTILWAGLLSFIGIAGPLSGTMSLQRIGIFGYAVVLPIAFGMIAYHFRDQIHTSSI